MSIRRCWWSKVLHAAGEGALSRRLHGRAPPAPVLGCGWCSMGSKGACVDQPNACADVANFYWTWELDGCPGAGDAGAANGGPDAGATD